MRVLGEAQVVLSRWKSLIHTSFVKDGETQLKRTLLEYNFLSCIHLFGGSLIVTFLLVHPIRSLKSRVWKVVEHFLDSSFEEAIRKSPIANEE